MNKEQIDEIAFKVARESNLRLDNACRCSTCRERYDPPRIKAFTHALLAELAKVQEPFGYYENGRWSIVTDGGPDKWRARKEYTGPLYLHPAPSVPEGYVMTPIEPTEEMIYAVPTDASYAVAYKAMLSAARGE